MHRILARRAALPPASGRATIGIEMVIAIVLAAGASSRMGRPKALLPVGAETFVSRVCRVLTDGGIGDVIVVVGPETAGVPDELERAGIRARVVENPWRDQGQLTSLQVGLAAADRPGVEAVLVHLVDAPLLAPSTVRAVVDTFRRTRAPVVRPLVGARHGHPVLFARSAFDDLRTADPAVGARAVVRAHAERSAEVAVDDPGACQDIDTPEDYERLIGKFPTDDI
jgi:molybdenum cofactor cytidylyltransferase